MKARSENMVKTKKKITQHLIKTAEGILPSADDLS